MKYAAFNADSEDWLKIFKSQQTGGAAIAFYQGSRHQRGAGIGTFLGKIWRVIPKFLNSVVGQSLVSGLTGVASDVVAGKSFKDAAKTRGREQVRNLVGVGRKRKRPNLKRLHYIS